ncbi:hypothetical protein VW23_001400 [Devosia insulae DS-56]|uniref:Protein NO VEIN C-terminal domain-containing protein n=1 Tax=Devosia insulae DS-56 TaxID=1116389 RepID=A0A1E5XNA8_9HYPH|nr:DUF3883 domain-containing protein [Devosia insulae]OEO30083.1 hypothetical protein VW23_001400 [Devosia insulae DS-56]
MKKVVWVKFGWSDYYRGGVVDGNFGWLKEAKGSSSEGRGHEAFNFMPFDGTYYCYVPPQTKEYAPWNEDNEGWTVICLAKNPRYAGIHIVGWYENATLLGQWQKPPGNHSDDVGGATSAYEWSYCIRSKSAFFIPPSDRTLPFSDPSIRQGKFSFLSGPSVETTSRKARVLAMLEERLAKLRGVAVHNPSEEREPDPELDAVDPLKGFGTPEHRKKVEKAAEEAVVAYYRDRGYRHFEDKTKIKCGHDFVFRNGTEALHVEVKGTSSNNPSFFLTRNEHAAGYQADPAWRLAMVTNALSEPTVTIFDKKGLSDTFDMTPYVFLGRPIVVP